MTSKTAGPSERPPRVPPRWFVVPAWAIHRAIFRLTGGRRGLWNARPDTWGTLRLRSKGRRSGKERIAILGYHEDGQNFVTLAMNGWGEGDPAWWLNLKSNPEAEVQLKGGHWQPVHARTAREDERERLWAMWRGAERYARHRTTETPLVVLEPRSPKPADRASG